MFQEIKAENIFDKKMANVMDLENATMSQKLPALDNIVFKDLENAEQEFISLLFSVS